MRRPPWRYRRCARRCHTFRSRQWCRRRLRSRTRGCGHGLRKDARAFPELVELEDADRAVPDDRSGTLEGCREALRRVGPDVEDHLVGRHLRGGLHVRFRRRSELGRDDDVARQRNPGADLRERLSSPRAMSIMSGSCSDCRSAAPPLPGTCWRCRHHDQLVDLAQVLEHGELVETFEPPTIAISQQLGFRAPRRLDSAP